MLFALDSNVILYFEGINDSARRDLAVRLVGAIGLARLVVPLQVLAEVFNRLAREKGVGGKRAAEMVSPWHANVRTQDVTLEVLQGAQDLVIRHEFSIWDALVLASAQACAAPVVLSEDLQDGFAWRDVTVINPFAAIPNPIIDSLLQFKRT